MRRSSRLAVLLALGLALLAACAQPEPTPSPTPSQTPAPGVTPTSSAIQTSTPTPSPTETTAAPAETAQAWLDALAARSSGELTALHIVEQRLLAGDAYTIWTDALKGVSGFSVLNPKVEATSQTGEKAEVTAEYDIGFGTAEVPVKTKFRLETENGEWLVAGLSGSAPEGLVGWTELFVRDAKGDPIGGAEVVFSTVEGDMSGTTDNEGMVLFELEYLREADSIVMTKEGYFQGGSGQTSGFYTVFLRPVIFVNQFMSWASPEKRDGTGVGDGDTLTFQVGETISIDALVRWHDDISPTTYDVVLKVDGEFYASVSVDVPDASGRDDAAAPFTLSFDEKGEYEIDANGISFTAVIE